MIEREHLFAKQDFDEQNFAEQDSDEPTAIGALR